MEITSQLVGKKGKMSENLKDVNGMRYEHQGLAIRSHTVTDKWTLLTRVFCYQDIYMNKIHTNLPIRSQTQGTQGRHLSDRKQDKIKQFTFIEPKLWNRARKTILSQCCFSIWTVFPPHRHVFLYSIHCFKAPKPGNRTLVFLLTCRKGRSENIIHEGTDFLQHLESGGKSCIWSNHPFP